MRLLRWGLLVDRRHVGARRTAPADDGCPVEESAPSARDSGDASSGVGGEVCPGGVADALIRWTFGLR